MHFEQFWDAFGKILVRILYMHIVQSQIPTENNLAIIGIETVLVKNALSIAVDSPCLIIFEILKSMLFSDIGLHLINL